MWVLFSWVGSGLQGAKVVEIRSHASMGALPDKAWRELLCDGTPFLEQAWLSALEETRSVHPESGWLPFPVGLYDSDELVAAAPAYGKGHSMGEFVYDWSWASAAERMGIAYYPKLIVGSPFSPVTGQRLLLRDPSYREPLVAGLLAATDRIQASGLHVQFCTEQEALELQELGGVHRLQLQFHWHNRGYATFDDFLQDFRSKRRKAIRRERRQVRDCFDLRVSSGWDIQPEEIFRMAEFYRSTCSRYGAWDYLNGDMWDWLSGQGRENLVLFLAERDGNIVAGSFCVRGGETLWGRYWGCGGLPEGTGLHFELCFYLPIEWCIAQGLSRFEPGQGGQHKLARGFAPSLCHSVHWLRNPNLKIPVDRFIEREREDVLMQQAALMEKLAPPLRRPLGLRSR